MLMLECKCLMFKELKTNQDNETQLKVFPKYVVLTKNYFVQHYICSSKLSWSVLCQAQDTEVEGETDLQVHCITCGLPLAPKVALRHMEKCYMKVHTDFCIQSQLYNCKIINAHSFTLPMSTFPSHPAFFPSVTCF